MKLIVDGKNAFPEIIRCMREAKESIYINMFIWRNDTIGNILAKEVLDAANRGVKVKISKDRYGIICESCEESRASFFHRSSTLKEKIKIGVLRLLYNRGGEAPFDAVLDDGKLLHKILEHPNITVEANVNKYDHSKYYVFDENILIFGGINVEDKEWSKDYFGRTYRDYMVEIDTPQLVKKFLQTINTGKNSHIYGFNIKLPDFTYGMKEKFLDIILSAEKELTIVMAYFSPLKEFEQAILSAASRNVEVKILIPESANFQDDLNKKTIDHLLNAGDGKIKAYLYPEMLHAKLVMNEKTITFGSCNITKKAFNQLAELNIFVHNDDAEFAADIRESVKECFDESEEIAEVDKYNHLKATIESFLV